MTERSDKMITMMYKAGLSIIANDIIVAAKQAELNANKNMESTLNAVVIAVIDKLTDPIGDDGGEKMFNDGRPIYSFRHLKELSEEIKTQLKMDNSEYGG